MTSAEVSGSAALAMTDCLPGGTHSMPRPTFSCQEKAEDTLYAEVN